MSLLVLPTNRLSDTNNVILPNARLYTFLTGTLTPATTYTTAALDTAYGAYVQADSSGLLPLIFTDPTVTYRCRVYSETTPGSGIFTAVDGMDFDPVVVPGSESITFDLGASGSRVVTVDDDLRGREVNAQVHFGCVGDGVTNDTAKMRDFFNYCISSGSDGYIPDGTYKTTPGLLDFDNGFLITPWPNIRTGSNVIFDFDTSLPNTADYNKPFIKITNGTYVSGTADGTWTGGSLGGIMFRDNSGHTTATSRHGLSHYGMSNTEFGYMRSSGLNGFLGHIPLKTVAGDPDYYAVYNCHYRGFDAEDGTGGLFRNENGQGWNFNTVDFLRGIQIDGGGLIGIGAGNKILCMSMGSVKSWQVDADTTTWGAIETTMVMDAELDNPEYGIRLQKYRSFKLVNARIVARYNYNNRTDNLFWPKTFFDIAAGTAGNVFNTDIEILVRVDPSTGANLGAFGTFANFNSAGFSGVRIKIDWSDNAAIGLTDANFIPINISAVANGLHITQRAKTIFSRPSRRAAKAIGNASSLLKHGDFRATNGGIIALPSITFDSFVDFSTSTYGFTIPYEGRIKIFAQITFANTASGKTNRLYALRNRGGTYSAQLIRAEASTGTITHSMALVGEISVNKDDIIYLAGDTDEAGDLSLATNSGGASYGPDNFCLFEMVEASNA